jgi:phosphoglucosamine mutase
MGELFGTDGIRGVANTNPMDVETAVVAGRAAAAFFRTDKQRTGPILIGQDTRISGDMIAHAVSAGICSAGLNVSMLGVVPTPAVAVLTRQTGAAAGIVISASHNPYADNGIKLFNTDGYKLSDADENRIEQLMTRPARAGEPLAVPSADIGRCRSLQSTLSSYIDFLRQSMPHGALNGIKIVLDCANGAMFRAAPELFTSMGADVTALYCEPDGTNINARCGSQFPETLARTVTERNAHIGLAFDGDGDRLIAVDEQGTILSGDQIIAVCAGHLKAVGQLRHDVVVTTVMSNIGLHHAMRRMGIRLVTSPVGDRYVMRAMRRQDAVLGGEDSGHIIFLDHHTTGDGLMAALRLIDAMQADQRPLSELSRVMTLFPQVMINVDVRSKPDLDTIPRIVEAIRSVETALADRGRVLVRYSGTQSKCRVMVEGPTEDETRRYCRQIADTVEKALMHQH